ncbi:hypothetical protein HK100_010977 [Physocladia obscura]|uniref:Poly [ADP-ribose] polymerase n=1 Tax=Physocladia obscura TaxID=109957 RepID=A0AAD5T8X5_9FUNG|nr:hypothetical protein HK100_010977 [Physocladia obscura]
MAKTKSAQNKGTADVTPEQPTKVAKTATPAKRSSSSKGKEPMTPVAPVTGKRRIRHSQVSAIELEEEDEENNKGDNSINNGGPSSTQSKSTSGKKSKNLRNVANHEASSPSPSDAANRSNRPRRLSRPLTEPLPIVKPSPTSSKKPTATSGKNNTKIIYISDDDEGLEYLLKMETDDSGDDDFNERKTFDVLEIAKSFYKRKNHNDGEDEDEDEGKSEDDNESENDGEENEGNEHEEGSAGDNAEPASKRRRASAKSKSGKKEKKEKAPRGKSAKLAVVQAATRQKNIQDRKNFPEPIITITDSSEPDTSCCLLCSSREFMRAATAKDLTLLKNTLANENVAPWYYANPPDDPLSNPLSKAVSAESEEFIHILMTTVTKNTEPPHAYIAPPASTGYQNNRTYGGGRGTKKVNESRGNREGNNAFSNWLDVSPYDFNKRGSPIFGSHTNTSGHWTHALRVACRLPYSEKTFDRLSLTCPTTNVQYMFETWGLYEAVSSGNCALAAKMLILMRDYQNSFNILHHEALNLDPTDTPYKKVLPVSVLKKSSREMHGVKPLHFSAINPDSNRLKVLLDAISASSALDADEMGRTVVHFAAACEGTGPLELLKDYGGFEFRSVDAAKMSPLLIAAKYGRADNVKFLIDAIGGGSAAADGTLLTVGYAALHFACGLGHLNVVKVLLDAGASIDLIDKKEKATPLMHVCKTGHLEIIKLLVSRGADIFAVDNMGRTPLIHACKNGHVEVVVYLLSEGADADACDTSQNYALHYACGYGWKEIVKILLDYGQTQLNSLNAWKCTPIMIADMKGHLGITQHLLQRPGIAVNFLNKDGYSMIHQMFLGGTISSKHDAEMRLRKLEILLKHGADAALKSIDGDTALHLMAGQWEFDNAVFSAKDVSEVLEKCLKLLIEYGGANLLLEEVDKAGRTPLAIALVKNRLALARNLMKTGAAVENVNSGGDKGGEKFVTLLLKAVGSVDAKKFAIPAIFEKTGFDKVDADFKDLGDECFEFLQYLRDSFASSVAFKNIVLAQLAEIDSEGYTPLLATLKLSLELQTTAQQLLENQCRSKNQPYYSWNQPQPIINAEPELVNLDHSMTFFIAGMKSLLQVIRYDTLSTFLNAKVKIPKGFKKKTATDPNPKYTGYTILHFAAHHRRSDLLKSLLESFPAITDKPDQQDDLGLTPLSLAVSKFDSSATKQPSSKYKFECKSDLALQLETVKILLMDFHANPMINSKQFESPVFRVLENLPRVVGIDEKEFGELPEGQKEIAEMLFAACLVFDGSVLDVLNGEGRSALIVAFEKGYDRFATILIDAGASLNLLGPKNVSIGLLAIRQNRISAARAVLNADLSIPDADGITCAMEAFARSEELAKLIFSKPNGSLNINNISKNKNTALIVAVKNSRSVEVVAKILALGADVNYSKPDGKTALIFAIERNDYNLVSLLIEYGANVHVQDKIDLLEQSAIHYAVLTRNNKIVAKLLEAGVNPNVVRSKDLATPLHVAVELSKKDINKSLKIERSLIKHGAKINAVDAQGRTPLHIAFFELGKIPVMDMTANEVKVRNEYESELEKYKTARKKLESYVKEIVGIQSDNEKANIFKWFYNIKAKLPENKLDEVVDKRSTQTEYSLGVMATGKEDAKNDPVEIVDFLVTQTGILPDIVDKFGRSPLHYAALIGASSCTNSLLKADVNLERPDKDGNTPLQLSLLGEHVDFYLNLGLQGASVNGKVVLANGIAESSFFYALLHGFMSIGYFIKNREKQNPCIAISDALRTGRYSLALSLASSAPAEDLKNSMDPQKKTLLHVLGDFRAQNHTEWEQEYAQEIFGFVSDINVNARDANGRTALICAAQNNQAVVLKLLLTIPGIDVNAVDDSGVDAIFNATVNASRTMISALLAKNAKVKNERRNSLQQQQQVSLVRAAVYTKNLEVVSLLLSAGADANSAEPAEKTTAVMQAVISNSNSILSKLVESGADLNRTSFAKVQNKKGDKILIKAGANVNAFHPLTHRTPFMEAMDRDTTKTEWTLLLESNVDINILDPKYNQTSFQRAVLENIQPFSKLSSEILKFKPDISKPNNETGLTLIDHAIIKKDYPLLKNLLALKADPNARSLLTVNSDSRTSLMIAIKNNDFEAVKLLVTNPVITTDINAIDQNGRNAIHYAVVPFENASYENIALIQYLSSHGASLEIVDLFGNRPIDYASRAVNGILLHCLQDLGSLPPTVENIEDDIMTDAIVPFSDLEADASHERARLEILAQEADDERIRKEASKRGIDVQTLKAEEFKKNNWAKVNPSAGVDETQVRVLYEGDGIEEYVAYDVILHKCDVSRGLYGENKFYIMQVLHNHLQDIHFLFNKWGDSSIVSKEERRSRYAGQYQKTPFNSREEAIAEFKKVFKSKSGNEWTGNPNDFVEKPGKYCLIKIIKKLPIKIKPINYDTLPKSSLPTAVEEVLKMFLHMASLKPSAIYYDDWDGGSISFEGALDSGIVAKAYKVLLNIRTTFKEMNAKMKDTTAIPSAKELLALREKLVVLSTDYFRLVPSKEGRQGLKPILSAEALSQEMIRINNLRDYDTSLSILFAASYNRFTYNPVDYAYATLKNEMKPLENKSERDLIMKWISRSNSTKADVLNILKIRRNGEDERFEEFHGNKRLLFHGSKMSNMLGILKHGLLVAPIEAPVTGYMFGKGIYFSDTFAKSWGYVNDYAGVGTEISAYGCMFVCEVALGNTFDLENSDPSFEAAKPGFGSTKGLGINVPNPQLDLTLGKQNTKIPVGPVIVDIPRKDPVSGKDIPRFLNYNEYIVYNPNQVRIKYLVLLRNSNLCHLCMKNAPLKPSAEYAADYKEWDSLPKSIPFEAEIAKALMQETKIDGKGLWQRDFSTKVVAGKSFIKKWNPPTALIETSKICKNCADSILMELMEDYCVENKGLIHGELQFRPNCWYGRECRTQQNKSHAIKYNHFCDKAVPKNGDGTDSNDNPTNADSNSGSNDNNDNDHDDDGDGNSEDDDDDDSDNDNEDDNDDDDE